tara:strand:- start:6751 stop:7296 length:546 start_codon:yes stop_codon:yes gene_type:complete
MDTSSIIDIKSEDILENLTNLLENSNFFKKGSKISSLKCIIFYLDEKNLIDYKKLDIKVNNNKLSKKELITMILDNKKYNSVKYDLTGIYKFELNLKESDVKNFCENSHHYSFITQYENIEDILFKPCIELFNDSNKIMLFFSKKTDTLKNTKKNKTKKKVKFEENKSSDQQHTKTSKNYS